MSCITEPWTCVGDAAGAVAGAVASSALDRFIESVTDAMQRTTNLFLTFWMSPALSPTVASGDAATSGVRALQDTLQTVTAVAAVVGVLLGCMQVALTHRAEPLSRVGMMFLSVITVSGLAAVTVQIGVDFGDAFSPWVLQQGTGASGGAVPDLYPKAASAALGAFLVIMLGGLVILANLAQIAFMMFRAGVLPLLLAVLPLAAAMSSSDAGRQWFKKVLGWLLAFVLYKPIAALVYAGGFAMMTSSSTKALLSNAALTDQVKPIFQILSGFVVVLLAVLCLPAMIKLVAPIAATGSSNLFSGAAAAGVAITGAVAVASLGAGAPALTGAAAGGGGAGAAGGGAAAGGRAAGGASGSAGGAADGAREIGSTPTDRAAITSGGRPGGGSGGGGGAPEAPASGGGAAVPALSSGTGPTSSPTASGAATSSSATGTTAVSGGTGGGPLSAPPPTAPADGGATGSGRAASAPGAGVSSRPAPAGYTAQAASPSAPGQRLGSPVVTRNLTDTTVRSLNDAVDGGEPPSGSR